MEILTCFSSLLSLVNLLGMVFLYIRYIRQVTQNACIMREMIHTGGGTFLDTLSEYRKEISRGNESHDHPENDPGNNS